MTHSRNPFLTPLWIGLATLAGCSGSGGGTGARPAPPPAPEAAASRSSPVQLSADGRHLFVVNKLASPGAASGRGSLSVVRVRDDQGADDDTVLAEIPVGRDPFSVSLDRTGTRAFVTNGADGTVTVVDLGPAGTGPYAWRTDVAVGSEPRGAAVNGDRLYVANWSDGNLAVVDTRSLLVVDHIELAHAGRRIANPFGVMALGSRGVWVTDFLARAVPGKSVDEIEGFDDGKEGRVAVVRGGAVAGIVALRPLADSGFKADRTAFDRANGAANDTFRAPEGVDPTAVPQGVFFNQLAGFAFDARGGRLYLPAIGAQPAPPVRFNVNVQSLVGVLETEVPAERADLHFNLNQRLAANGDPAPSVPFTDPATRLDRAFFADFVAMDVAGSTAVMISRAGSYLLRGEVGTDGAIQLARDARGAVLRIPTTNVPHGIVLDAGATRAYVASELVGEVTIVDLERNAVVEDIETAGTPTDPLVRRELLGKLAFFTGMGLPADVDPDTDPRSIDTHRFRNMASAGNWSSCASCHPDGRTDGVTWLFPTGPRQTPSLEGFFAPGSTIESNLATTDQKVSNWNAVRGSITDFNNNTRNVQGGFGFTPLAAATIDAGGRATDVPDAGLAFNHGPRLGVSNALDFMTQWVASVRVHDRPSQLEPLRVARGRTLFANSCAECHGGTKWTRSTRVLDLQRWPDPAFAGNLPLSVNLQNPAATVISAFDRDGDGLFETPIVQPGVAAETLDLLHPIEIRGLGADAGRASAGLAASFVPPSLFNARNTAPYGHHGRAQTLEKVFDTRAAGGLGHPVFGLGAEELRDVLEFVRAIDGAQPILP